MVISCVLSVFVQGKEISVADFDFCRPRDDLCGVDDIPLEELLSCLNPSNISTIVMGLLHELHLLFISSSLHRLTACVHAAVSLLHPLDWYVLRALIQKHSKQIKSGRVYSCRFYPRNRLILCQRQCRL